MSSNTSWITINNKVKNKTKNNNKKSHIRISRDWVILQLRRISSYHPVGIFLVGSTARDNHTALSDIDVLVIWKRSQWGSIKDNDQDMEIRKELEQIFKRKVDFTSLVYQGKLLIDTDIDNITNN